MVSAYMGKKDMGGSSCQHLTTSVGVKPLAIELNEVERAIDLQSYKGLHRRCCPAKVSLGTKICPMEDPLTIKLALDRGDESPKRECERVRGKVSSNYLLFLS